MFEGRKTELRSCGSLTIQNIKHVIEQAVGR